MSLTTSDHVNMACSRLVPGSSPQSGSSSSAARSLSTSGLILATDLSAMCGEALTLYIFTLVSYSTAFFTGFDYITKLKKREVVTRKRENLVIGAIIFHNKTFWLGERVLHRSVAKFA